MAGDTTSVWLGAPQRPPYTENPLDPFTSKIGGRATYFRLPAAPTKKDETPSGEIPSAFECPKCHSTDHVTLLSQLFAPLEPFDRVLYVLMCTRCTHSSKPPTPARSGAASAPLNQTAAPSVCFAVRSENFNKQAFDAMIARRAQEEASRNTATVPTPATEGNLFEENMDWGDGGATDDWGGDDWNDVSEPKEPVVPQASEAPCGADVSAPAEQEEYPIAPVGRVIPFKSKPFSEGIPLDLFEEPDDPLKKKKPTSVEEQLEQLEARYGGDVVDATSVEKDDETPQEKFVRKYMERIEWEPSQCVRWCPGGRLLCTSTQTPALAEKVPRCARCGADRRFELQLTAPVVYFLTKEDGGEKKNQYVHFSNVHVFTCGADCSGVEGYTREHVIVEEEI